MMRRQEETVYKCESYLSTDFQESLQSACNSSSSVAYPNLSSLLSSSQNTNDGGLTELWREKICEWCYQVVDHYDYSRETVAVALSHLDRFLCTRTVNKKIFQLAAMTSLYLAVKLNEPGILRMSSLIELSRGYFLVDHIASMEEILLRSLSWHVHPPTAIAFVRYLSLLMPDSWSTSMKLEITELSRFLAELSVCDYFFVTLKPSSVALAALITAMDFNKYSHYTSDLLSIIQANTGLDSLSPEVRDCCMRLAQMYYHGGYQNHTRSVRAANPYERGPSPTGVNQFSVV